MIPSMHPPAVQRLLHGIIARDRAARLVASAARATLVAAVLLMLVGVAGRLSGLRPGLLLWPDLVIAPAAGLAWALLRVRPMSRLDAARRADLHLGSQDLLLAAIAPAVAPALLAEVVVLQAERYAGSTEARRIVPVPVRRPLLRGLLVLAVCALLVALVPTLDPFARQQHLRAAQEQRREMERAHAAVLRRAAEIAAAPQASSSAVVASELAKLQAELQAMKPAAVEANKQTLSAEQAALRGRLDQVREERFSHSVDPNGAQELGSLADRALAKQLSDALDHGKAAESQAAIDQAAAIAQQLKAATDPKERARLAEDLQHRLATLQAAAQAHPSGFSAAVQNALDQLGRSSSPELRDQALQGLGDALGLAKLEAGSDAQGAKDQQDLQQALQTLQMAQQLNDQGDLQGQAGDLEAYAKLYAQLLADREAQAGDGSEGADGHGHGQGGSGQGNRTDTLKDDGKVDAGFTPAQQHAPLKPGQTLAQWTVHGQTDPGSVLKSYQSSLLEVKQEVPAALEREQVPPAYHEGVKKYFDGLAADH